MGLDTMVRQKGVFWALVTVHGIGLRTRGPGCRV